MKWGPEHAEKHDLCSLRLLGSVGEPINPEAWMWYREQSAPAHARRRHLVADGDRDDPDHAAAGVTTVKPGSATRPFPAIDAAVWTSRATRSARAEAAISRSAGPGRRCCAGSTTTTTGTWRRTGAAIPGVYFAGDGAQIDADGDFWLMGRVDDVMNVSGHRISTIEVESALVDHPAVAEAAVCGRIDSATGQAIVAFVTLKGGDEGWWRCSRSCATTWR